MCWIGKVNSNSHHIAKEDISCFKVVEFRNDIIRSVYQDWNIYTLSRKEKRLNPLVKIKHFYSDDKIFEIHRGFHSYSDDCKIVVYNGMFQYFQIEYSSIMLDIFIPSIKSSRSFPMFLGCIIPTRTLKSPSKLATSLIKSNNFSPVSLPNAEVS